jgi:hypothetical protein
MARDARRANRLSRSTSLHIGEVLYGNVGAPSTGSISR